MGNVWMCRAADRSLQSPAVLPPQPEVVWRVDGLRCACAWEAARVTRFNV